MKKLTLPIIGCLLVISGITQENPNREYRNFPVTLSLQFNSFAMPFGDMTSLFSNVGIGIGTAVSLNGHNHHWLQEFNAVWYRNSSMGNGLLLYTQTAWQPGLGDDAYAAVKAGIGYLVSYRPSKGYVQQLGEWKTASKKGKGMLAIPLGIGLGYHHFSEVPYLAPFATYQFMPAFGYNKTVPIVPETLLQVGAAYHVKY